MEDGGDTVPLLSDGFIDERSLDPAIEEALEETGVLKPKHSDQFTAQRTKIMVVMNIVMFFVPISGVTYVPSIPVIQDYFHATQLEMTLTLVGFCIFIGAMPLVYGPIADLAGRKPSLIACLVGYGAANVMAGSSENIWGIIVYRSLIATFNAGFTTFCTGIISDVVPVEDRATSIGVSLLLAMAGTILGSPAAGLVNDFLSWRMVFYFTALGAFPVALLVGLAVPETNDFSKPKVSKNPLHALVRLCKWPLVGMVVPNAFAFGAMYTINSELSPLLAYYFNLSSAQIGLLYMPFGVGMLVGTIFGGKISDVARRRFGLGGSLSIALISAVVTAAMTVIYGWVAPSFLWLSVIIASLTGFGAMASRGVIFTYATELNKDAAGTVTSGLVCVQFAVTVVELFLAGRLVPPPEKGGIGPGWSFTIVAGLVVVFLPLMIIVIVQAFRQGPGRPRMVPEGGDGLLQDNDEL
mmetsp:Transcript_8150/g.34255  ORF Transcript_8150/g.34255 Transcript_8150/m.34255 type:complete len:467 (+) Transcript_8150:54-1454(+)